MKRIPAGSWVLALNLAETVTEESLREFLYQCGADIPIENISVHQTAKGTNALVSISNATGAVLLNWAINNALLDSRPVKFAGWEARGVPRTESGIGYYVTR